MEFDPAKHCGAKTGRGPCKNPKGKNTDHRGYGCCANHLGATKTGRLSAYNQELIADALSWAQDVEGDTSELLLAMGRLQAARAILADRKAAAAPDDIVWQRYALDATKAAADVQAKIIALGLEDRRVQIVEKARAPITAAAVDAMAAMALILNVSFTNEARLEFARVFQAGLEVHEHRGEVLELPSAA